MSITVSTVHGEVRVWSGDGYDALTPAEARALAWELVRAADEISKDSAPCPVCSDCLVCGGSHTLPILDWRLGWENASGDNPNISPYADELNDHEASMHSLRRIAPPTNPAAVTTPRKAKKPKHAKGKGRGQ